MIYNIKDFLKKFFSSRLFVLAAVIIFMFALLAERVFTLQIIKGADYQKNFIMLIKKPLSIEASRGNSSGFVFSESVLFYGISHHYNIISGLCIILAAYIKAFILVRA